MTGKAILNGFPLKINVSLLAIAIVIVSVAISSLSDKETLRNICLLTGCLLTLLAVVPSSFGSVWEDMRKGKPRYIDPNTVIPEWKKFCQSMGIKENIMVKVFPNLRNAYARYTTIGVGQPVLDSLDSVSIKGVFAHELAHIKGKHALKQACLLVGVLVGVLFAAVPLLGVSYSFDPSGSSLLWLSVLLVLVDFTGIAMRFISWPFEYKADLIAKQYVNREAVVSLLTAMVALRKMDVTRDFYRHPSVNKRIANLDWSQKTRFRKWHFEL